MSREHRFNAAGRRAVPDARLVTRARQVVDRQHGSEVHERRATVVVGIPLHRVASPRSMRRDRRVLTPFTRRLLGVVTSGGGAAPFRTPSRKAADRPLSSAPSPQARTAAMYCASTLGAGDRRGRLRGARAAGRRGALAA